MVDILIQFHASVSELADFARAVAAREDVHVVALRFGPFAASVVRGDDIGPALADPGVRELVFTLQQPELGVANLNAFLDRNPGALRLTIGRQTQHGLGESSLGARAADEAAISAWRRAASALRRMTSAGATAMNPLTGATSTLRNHRFTKGAKELNEAGVVIRPVAGTAVLHLGASRGPPE